MQIPVSVAVLAMLIVLPLFAAAQPPKSGQGAASASAPTQPSPTKSAPKQGWQVTLHGELSLVMVAAPFGPSTKVRDGTFVFEVEAQPMPLAIKHDGKDYRIYITRENKLNDELRSGMFSPDATYRVTGTLSENVIFATEIMEE